MARTPELRRASRVGLAVAVIAGSLSLAAGAEKRDQQPARSIPVAARHVGNKATSFCGVTLVPCVGMPRLKEGPDILKARLEKQHLATDPPPMTEAATTTAPTAPTTTLPPKPPTPSTTTPPTTVRPAPATTAPPPTEAVAASGTDDVTPEERAEWTKVAVCEEGGWVGYSGPAYPDSLGINAYNWYHNGGGSDVSEDAQIRVARRIQSNPPDQNGCDLGGW